MHETAAELEQVIAAKHSELSQNLTALDTKASELTDWRAQFEQRPLVVLGAAVAGGVVLAALLGGSRSRSREAPSSHEAFRPVSRPSDEGTWQRFRSSVGLVAAGAAMEMLSSAVPGIKKNLIDPVREQMAKKAEASGMNRGNGGFTSASPAHMSGFHASDAT